MVLKEGTIFTINKNLVSDDFVGLYTNFQGNVIYRGPKTSEGAKSKGNRHMMIVRSSNNSYYLCRFQGVNDKEIEYDENGEPIEGYLENGKIHIFEEGSFNNFFTKDSMLCIDFIIEVDKNDFDDFAEKYKDAFQTKNVSPKTYKNIYNDVVEVLTTNLPNIPIVKVDVKKLLQKPIKQNDGYFNNIGKVININPYLIDKENRNANKNKFDKYKTLNFLETSLIKKYKKWELNNETKRVLKDIGAQPNQSVLDFEKNSKDFEIFVSEQNKIKNVDKKIEYLKNKYSNEIKKIDNQLQNIERKISKRNNQNFNNKNKYFNNRNFNQKKYVDADNDRTFSIFKRKKNNERER